MLCQLIFDGTKSHGCNDVDPLQTFNFKMLREMPAQCERRSLVLAFSYFIFSTKTKNESCLDLFSQGLSTYLDFLDGKVPMESLVPLYTGIDAVTDQPTCHLWPILLQLFPDAKVNLPWWPDLCTFPVPPSPGNPDGKRRCRAVGGILLGNAGLLQWKHSALVFSSPAALSIPGLPKRKPALSS